MKRFAVIFFIFAILFAQTELHQLAKLPVLVQHFFEHKAENNQLSLAGFLKMHYFNDDGTSKDDARDMQLPFKSNDCAQVSGLYFANPLQQQFSMIAPLVQDRSTVMIYQEWIPGSHVSDIFQPPKRS